jgi:hypothetical protein
MMKHTMNLFAVAVLLSIATATSAFAADDGNTQPKLTSGGVGGGISSPQDIIGTTNGAGNVKGVQCSSPSSGNLTSTSINIFVNGGGAQTLSLSNAQVLLDSGSNYYIMYIPMNVRFGTSIRVQQTGSQSGSFVSCTVSWALD